MSTIGERYQRLRAQLPSHVTLVAVSKYHAVSQIQEAYDAGCRDFGESREQELLDKAAQLPSDIRWHFIGHLQRNKVKKIIPVVHLIHSVDTLSLWQKIDQCAEEAGRVVDCLLQLHVAEEETKFGFSLSELEALVGQSPWHRYTHARLSGLMAMATHTNDEERVREDFLTASNLFAQWQGLVGNPSFRILSMGMSDDYPLALEAHTTMVRIGSAIFGERT